MKNWLNQHAEESNAYLLSKWKGILNAVLQFARESRPVLSLVGFIVYSSLESGVEMPHLEMIHKLWQVC